MLPAPTLLKTYPRPGSAAGSAAGSATGPGPGAEAGLAFTSARRIRVLVVDDSVVIRRFLARVLAEDPAFEVVGFAAHGISAISQAAELRPDAITMDIEMPEMDGLAAVRELRSLASRAVIIMCSTLTSRGASSTIEALIAGANDYVTKPGSSDSMNAALEALRLELIPKIKQFFTGREFALPATVPLSPVHGAPRLQSPALLRPRSGAGLLAAAQRRIVAIGVSTGGPTALMKLLPALPIDFPLPIVIVQHMPPIFTRQMADRLSAVSALEVVEAVSGMPLKPGRVIVAPGDFHLRLERAGHDTVVKLDQGERENSCRPAVDVLFRSVADLYGGNVLAIMLTGMGQDGLRGTEVLKAKGAYIMAQDRATSVVWSMPGAVAEAGLANSILPLDEMAAAMLRQVPSR